MKKKLSLKKLTIAALNYKCDKDHTYDYSGVSCATGCNTDCGDCNLKP